MALVLSDSVIADLIDDVDVVAAVRTIHEDLARGAAVQPPPQGLESTGDDHLVLPMTARSDRLGLSVVKLMVDAPSNAARGLATQRSTIMLSANDTGECVAILDGALITRYRTAAASAVATQALARPDATTIGMIGAGRLAIQHVVAMAHVLPLERILVWSRSASTVADFLSQIGPALASRTTVLPSPRDVVEGSEILSTVTPSIEPIVQGGWLHPGLHLNAVGARPRPDHRELDGDAMSRATIVVDSAPTAWAKSGDLLEAVREGRVAAAAPLTELGSVLIGDSEGRTTPDDITIFDSVGLAAQDLALAAELVTLARTRGVGRHLDLAPAPAAVG